jgi:hypothetical protein
MPDNIKPMRTLIILTTQTQQTNKQKSIHEKLSRLFCQTHKPRFSKRDAVHGLYVAFEILQVFENEPLRLACWVIIFYPGFRVFSFEVNLFDVIYYFRRAAERAYPLFVAFRFVSNTKQVLSLIINKGDDTREWISFRRFFLNDWSCREYNSQSIISGYLTIIAESLYKIGGLNLALDSILRHDIRDASIDQVG